MHTDLVPIFMGLPSGGREPWINNQKNTGSQTGMRVARRGALELSLVHLLDTPNITSTYLTLRGLTDLVSKRATARSLKKGLVKDCGLYPKSSSRREG